ncbi:MAG: hypothetical protein K2J58_05505, partial [Muribaculaceae bacterium]|nr:hypothetical protein [Muribaculaceae bacterium]
IGTINCVTLHDIRIDEAGPSGSSITGLTGHPVTDILLHDITIRHAGGQTAIPTPTDEKELDYPESTMWGILPAQGFWLNHASDITFRNVRVIPSEPDARPIFLLNDCRNIITDGN